MTPPPPSFSLYLAHFIVDFYSSYVFAYNVLFIPILFYLEFFHFLAVIWIWKTKHVIIIISSTTWSGLILTI